MDTRCLYVRIRCDAPTFLLEIKNGYGLPLRKIVSAPLCQIDCPYKRFLSVTVINSDKRQTAFLDLSCHHPKFVDLTFRFDQEGTQNFFLTDSTYFLPVKRAVLSFK